MRREEQRQKVSPNYVSEMQTGMKAHKRGSLIDWIIDIHSDFKLASETLYMTVFILDSYLSKKKVHASQLH